MDQRETHLQERPGSHPQPHQYFTADTFARRPAALSGKRKSNKKYFFSPLILSDFARKQTLPLTSLTSQSDSGAPETSKTPHARSSAAPSSAYAAPWQRLGCQVAPVAAAVSPPLTPGSRCPRLHSSELICELICTCLINTLKCILVRTPLVLTVKAMTAN